ncbi:MAG: site-2 protease family protein [Planctomycetes bacterium]|nr:site-2 protease family protein [Planctomycetota bacterium]
MLLGEPPPTQADLHFRLFGFPVRVHPFFWLITLMLAMGGGSEKLDPVDAFVWVAVVFLSILVHELGHAFLQRRFGGHPRITLYGMGGLASCNDCDRSPRSQIMISLAGPVAGFLLAAAVMLLLNLTGHRAGFALTGDRIDLAALGVDSVLAPRLLLFNAYFEPLASAGMNQFVSLMLWVNVAWGIVNLLPIYPLDGGHIARELFTLHHPRRGIIQSLQLSIGAAILMAVYGLTRQSMFTVLMFGLLAYSSYQTLQAYQRH